MQLLRRLIMAAVLLMVLPSGASATVLECEVCSKTFEDLRKATELRFRYANIVLRNRQYLVKNPSSDPSVRIKVNSNILIGSLRIETSDNQIEVLKQELIKKGCKVCLKPVG